MYDRKSGRYKDLAGPNTKYILVGSEAKDRYAKCRKNFTKLSWLRLSSLRKTKKLKKTD